nr:MAG TPA: hypothetical protein [Caudoviricetes sp.]DAV60252.1 MAG TPA: hypothetical protein [Caudoviricetes sp.]
MWNTLIQFQPHRSQCRSLVRFICYSLKFIQVELKVQHRIVTIRMNPVIVFYLRSYIIYNLIYVSKHIISIHIRSYWQLIV